MAERGTSSRPSTCRRSALDATDSGRSRVEVSITRFPSVREPAGHWCLWGAALEEARVPNELVTVSGGGHGGFTDAESARIYTAIRDFLSTHGVLKGTSN